MTDKKETKTKKSCLRYREKRRKRAPPALSRKKRKRGECLHRNGGKKKNFRSQGAPFRQIGGGITINDKKLNEYFPTAELRGIVESPLKTAKMEKYEITVRLSGGGIHSQAEALRHGISRALIELNAELRKELKPLGFLMRDPRMKERRKFGLKKARKAPQWSKR